MPHNQCWHTGIRSTAEQPCPAPARHRRARCCGAQPVRALLLTSRAAVIKGEGDVSPARHLPLPPATSAMEARGSFLHVLTLQVLLVLGTAGTAGSSAVLLWQSVISRREGRLSLRLSPSPFRSRLPAGSSCCKAETEPRARISPGCPHRHRRSARPELRSGSARGRRDKSAREPGFSYSCLIPCQHDNVINFQCR